MRSLLKSLQVLWVFQLLLALQRLGRNLEVAIDLLGLEGSLKDLVSADDVTHGKPDPEVFLKGR